MLPTLTTSSLKRYSLVDTISFGEHKKLTNSLRKELSAMECQMGSMLDIERRTPERQKQAEEASRNPKALADFLNRLQSEKGNARYETFKVVYIVSEDFPEVLYPKWALFEDMLKSDDNAFKFYGIHILANLARVVKTKKFETVFDAFFDIVNGDALIPAGHVAYVAHKIVKANPELAEKVTERLLNLDKATYKHKEIVQANALRSFSEYFELISNKDKIIAFAKELQKSKSSRAKKEATDFLKQHPK
jgi:hypothetical protein